MMLSIKRPLSGKKIVPAEKGTGHTIKITTIDKLVFHRVSNAVCCNLTTRKIKLTKYWFENLNNLQCVSKQTTASCVLNVSFVLPFTCYTVEFRFLEHTMTRLTRDTALREISHMYMRPNRSTMIIATVKVTIRAILKLNPRRTKVTTKMAAERKTKTRSET